MALFLLLIRQNSDGQSLPHASEIDEYALALFERAWLLFNEVCNHLESKVHKHIIIFVLLKVSNLLY